jgi:SNF2 family DNA or RNA helicase
MVRAYGKIYLDEDKKHWKINNAEPHVCIKLKAIFAKLSASATQPFSFDNTPEVCQDLLWFTERYPLAISEADMLVMKREKKKHVNNINDIERILLPDYQPKELTLKDGYQARHYQLTGVDVYMKVKRLLIGDDIGTGKTIIGILSCLHKETRPCAVVVQTHLPKQWKDQVEMFTGLTVHLIKGTRPYDLPPADIYIFKLFVPSRLDELFRNRVFQVNHF